MTPALVNGKRNAAVLTAIPKTAPDDRATEDVVRNLRSTTIPRATRGQHMSADVGGSTAGYIDLADRIADRLPELIGVVVLLSFILLMLAFRSIVVPLKAGVMNLLSIGASYGVVTFVFQEGHGATAIGLDHAVPIVSFVPLLMFAILFGLSMDYEVFLITQIQERYRATHDNVESVVEGLGKTGKVITSAALIMVCVFASFVLNGDPTVKQFGLGLAVAIAVDATVVRCFLVPAAMVLMKNGNWWFPAFLERHLPHLGIEGEEYFAARDAVAVGAGGAMATVPVPEMPPVHPEAEPVPAAEPAKEDGAEPEPAAEPSPAAEPVPAVAPDVPAEAPPAAVGPDPDADTVDFPSVPEPDAADEAGAADEPPSSPPRRDAN